MSGLAPRERKGREENNSNARILRIYALHILEHRQSSTGSASRLCPCEQRSRSVPWAWQESQRWCSRSHAAAVEPRSPREARWRAMGMRRAREAPCWHQARRQCSQAAPGGGAYCAEPCHAGACHAVARPCRPQGRLASHVHRSALAAPGAAGVRPSPVQAGPAGGRLSQVGQQEPLAAERRRPEPGPAACAAGRRCRPDQAGRDHRLTREHRRPKRSAAMQPRLRRRRPSRRASCS